MTRVTFGSDRDFAKSASDNEVSMVSVSFSVAAGGGSVKATDAAAGGGGGTGAIVGGGGTAMVGMGCEVSWAVGNVISVLTLFASGNGMSGRAWLV